MKSEYTKGEWVVGWGVGLTGPTTQSVTPVCGGRDWPVIPVSVGAETIAICPAQTTARGIGTHGKPIIGSAQTNAHLIAQAPKLYEALKDAYSLLETLTTHQYYLAKPVFSKMDKAIALVEEV